MLRAKVVNEATIDTITKLNDGVRPDEECLDNKTYFVYSDSDGVCNELLTNDVFHATYRFTTSGIDNTIEAI